MRRDVLDISAVLSNVEHVADDEGTRPNGMLLDGRRYVLRMLRLCFWHSGLVTVSAISCVSETVDSVMHQRNDDWFVWT